MADHLGVSVLAVRLYRRGGTGISGSITKLLEQASKHQKPNHIKITKISPQEFKKIQEALGWSNKQMAKYLCVSVQSVSGYRNGAINIRGPVARLMEQASEHIKTMKMSPQEFKEKQKVLGWSNKQMAAHLGRSVATVSNYRRGATGIPIKIARLLEQASKRGNMKMSPQEFRKKQKVLGLNNRQMADYLGVPVSSVCNYRRGIGHIRRPIIRLLEQANGPIKVTKIAKMTPQEFKEKQKVLGLNNRQMAEHIGVSLAIMFNYRTGVTDIPIVTARLLEQAQME